MDPSGRTGHLLVVIELVRIRVEGPTVDGIALDGLYGVIALVGGCGTDTV